MKKVLKVLSAVMALVLVIACFAACGKQDGIKIGVQTTTTGDIYASDDFGEDAVVRYDNGAVAVEALKNGKVDCVIIDNEPAKSYVAANTGLKILETEYAVEDYAICFQKGNTALKDAVDAALKDLIADGSVKAIVDKYINSNGTATGLAGVPVTAVDTEKPNLVMVSLRSVDDFPCNLMAADFFNGGGHLNASGGKLHCTIEEAVKVVERAFLAYEDKLK